ncbi:glycoside hydrolase family 76 protein [Amniculicola lignicola CBS 123094]|uniref:mannan endo-1,6-alpha-mannosidase n=1 Tax=Amniculicola lignicola CBS 123094 TaxID=1392246 RepID=A0A6A5WNX2_9PLEO|nr:glycoside hydrolase family 76 protein [Amniculicola lignicola CBS 123094]
MKFFFSIGAVLLPFAALVSGVELNADDEASIKEATAKYAHGLMSLYKNNATDTPETEIGIFPKPLYWWEAGAAWGAMVEYTQLTGDESYVGTLQQALVANYGPENDIILPWKKDQEGNDDQAFWALAIMSALEYQFPEPSKAPAKYLEVAENSFKNIVSRWDTTSCNGGLKWQIYPENAYGYNYKNTISNGATFALAARLARYTGKQEYADWAVKLWDWTKAVGLISDKYEVYDGTGDKENCTKKDETQWSYNIGILLHGAAAMYDFTKQSATWKTHTSGLLDHTTTFFGPYDNATGIMFEVACETGETGRICNLDQQSFKAYLSRFMAKTAILAPFTKDRITKLLKTSALAAAKSCSGGPDGATCGSRWYTGGWDGTSGVGQQLCALEVTQALLTIKNSVVPATSGDEKPEPVSSSATPSSSKAPASSSISIAFSLDLTTTSASEASPTSEASPVKETDAISSSTPSGSQATGTPDDTLTGGFVYPSASSTAKGNASAPLSSKANTPGPSSTSNPVPTSKPGGNFNELPQNGTSVCTCTPSSTTTIYVPYTSAPAPPVSVAVSVPAPVPSGNATVPSVPPTTTSGTPAEFTGAAVNVKTTTVSVLGAAAIAVLCGLF